MKNSMIKMFFALLISAALFVPAWGLSAGGGGEDDEATIQDAHGTIHKVGNFGYAIVPDEDPGTRYAPVEALAEEFCEDGLRVIFSGKVGSSDDRGGRGGRPLGDAS